MARIQIFDAAGKKLIVVSQRMPNNVTRVYEGVGASGMRDIIAHIRRDKQDAVKAQAGAIAFERRQEMAAWRT